jgi:hypothetical protein
MVSIRRRTGWLLVALVGAAVLVPSIPAAAATPAWRAQPIADPGAPQYGLDDVSCSASNACTGVGFAYTPGNAVPQVPLAERWDGVSWTVQATPTPPGVTDSGLLSVSCPTASTCVAVGLTSAGTTVGTIAMMWDGTTWSLSPLVTPTGATIVEAADVDCVSATWCKLAGTVGRADGTSFPWVATWNGTTWSLDTVPVPASATSGALAAIDCFSQTACAAVGNFISPGLAAAGRAPALAETWNGKTWHVDSAADPGGQTLPSDVSCPAAGTCFMVGHYQNGAGHSAALVEKKAGSLWLSQAAPQPKTGTEHGLISISCTSTSSCETVGYAYGGGAQSAGYAAAYGGLTGWKLETEPARDYLQRIACPAKAFCIAVGFEQAAGVPTSAIRS